MSDLVEAVVDIIVYVCGWRILLCLGLGVGLAYLLAGYNVWLFYPLDIPIVTVILSFTLGVYWEVGANGPVS